MNIKTLDLIWTQITTTIGEDFHSFPRLIIKMNFWCRMKIKKLKPLTKFEKDQHTHRNSEKDQVDEEKT
ncbi:hypothetical protein SDC9_62413 [bioreactor metagenome]|uniref:Uncharacterized protein n=1 Tax=bioreactor metagenome TaxID=1076179 RepID=A0A644XIW8_9ZZZZ